MHSFENRLGSSLIAETPLELEMGGRYRMHMFGIFVESPQKLSNALRSCPSNHT
jgi:hypothetical protein